MARKIALSAEIKGVRLLLAILIFIWVPLSYANDDTCGRDSQIEKAQTEKVQALTLKASQGEASAQFDLGLQYFNGYGVPKDYVQAAKWFRKSADQGIVLAQYNLGLLYFYGQGLTQDFHEAAVWLRKAAEQGHAKAQYNLGVMYQQGKGVLQDFQEAAVWLRKAAEQGRADAQYSLGRMYGKGEGVPVDPVQAYFWFDRAARDGDEQAAIEKQSLGERMSQEQLARAQELVRNGQVQQR